MASNHTINPGYYIVFQIHDPGYHHDGILGLGMVKSINMNQIYMDYNERLRPTFCFDKEVLGSWESLDKVPSFWKLVTH